MRALVAAGLALAVVGSGVAAQAATVGHWAAYVLTGGSGAAVTVTDVQGFPAATLVTDTTVTAPTGTSTWLAASTDPGAVYGTSRNLPYLTVRATGPAAGPAVATYTFARPTPAGGWMLALGDVDAEYLDVTAVAADGTAVPTSALGFRTAFNLCVGAGTPSCDAAKAKPAPLWDPATGRLAGPELDGGGAPIPGWSDTDGATAWFEPQVPLRSLTITSTTRIGSPTYQAWVAALSRDATGTVTGPAECAVSGLDVVLRDGPGAQVATTTTDANGAWSFAGLATYADWTVSVTAPTGCDVVGADRRTADLSSADAVVDTQLVVEAAQPPPDPTDPPPADSGTGGAGSADDTVLPDTGAPPLQPLWLGIALTVAGLVAMRGSRPGLSDR